MAPKVSRIREFRHKVALLKKAGLLTLPKGLDARSIQPQGKTGKRVQKLIDKFDDVISNKATPVTVSPSEAKRWKKAGKIVVDNKVIVPHAATERVRKERGEIIIESTRAGISRIQIPVPFSNLDKFLRDIQTNAKTINAMKRRNEYFGFRFFGNNSSQIYTNVQALIDDLAAYQSVMAANTRAKQQQIYQNLEIVRIGTPDDWEFPSERSRRRSAKGAAKRARKYRSKMPRAKKTDYNEQAAERMRKYRARMKKDGGKKYKQYKKDGAKRANKARGKK